MLARPQRSRPRQDLRKQDLDHMSATLCTMKSYAHVQKDIFYLSAVIAFSDCYICTTLTISCLILYTIYMNDGYHELSSEIRYKMSEIFISSLIYELVI